MSLSPGRLNEASSAALAALENLTPGAAAVASATEGPDVADVCRAAVRTLGTMPPVHHCELFTVDAVRRSLRLKLWHGYEPPAGVAVLSMDGRSIVAHVARSGQLYLSDDVASDPHYMQTSPSTRAELALPLRAGGAVVGVLNLESREPDAFSPDVVAVCESFASGISTTLEGADLTDMLIRAKVALERVFDASSDAVAILDGEGRIFRLNRALARQLGRPLRELLGQEVSAALPFCREWLARATPAGGGGSAAWETLEDPERGLTYEACLQHLDHPWPSMGDRVLYLRDVTQQREMSRRMISVERRAAVGDLLAGVAHEVRSPLTALQAAVDVLQAGLGGEEDARLAIDIIARQVQRLKTLMSELLEFGGPGADLFPSPASLRHLCERTVALWKENPANAGREVQVQAPSGDIVVCVQPTRIEQVLVNLLDNAAQNSGPASPIDVLLAADEGSARVAVRDAGRGLSPQTLERMFEPFFTSRPGGTGLGLALVRSIVDSHGGSVSAWNNAPPPGCTVEFALPLPARAS